MFKGCLRMLQTSALQNRETIGIPIHELDAIATQIDKHEEPAVTNIHAKLVFNDTKEAIKAISHVDRLGVKIDSNRRGEAKHQLAFFAS